MELNMIKKKCVPVRYWDEHPAARQETWDGYIAIPKSYVGATPCSITHTEHSVWINFDDGTATADRNIVEAFGFGETQAEAVTDRDG